MDEGLNQFLDRGYHGTTVDGLLDVTGVPKGSFYHHFGSKDVFAASVLERYGHLHQQRLARWAARVDLAAPDRLVGYFGELADTCIESDYRLTDLVGKLAAEVSTTSDRVHSEITRIVGAWRSHLEELLRNGQACGDIRTDRSAAELSAAIHALINGFFVIAPSTRRPSLASDITTAIHALLVERR